MVVTECAASNTEMTAPVAIEKITASREAGESDSNALRQLWTVAGLCNASEFDAATLHAPLAKRKIHGDATDQAILRFAESLGPISDLKRSWQTKFELAFNSKNKFMIRVFGLTKPESLIDAVPATTASRFEPGDL